MLPTKSEMMSMRIGDVFRIDEYRTYKRVIGGWVYLESWDDSYHDVTSHYFVPYDSVVHDPLGVAQQQKEEADREAEDLKNYKTIQFLRNESVIEEIQKLIPAAEVIRDKNGIAQLITLANSNFEARPFDYIIVTQSGRCYACPNIKEFFGEKE